MNKEAIVHMAWEAGMGEYLWLSPKVDGYAEEVSSLERFAALVEAHEREECAKLCEDNYEDAILCANAIRKRGEQ